MAFDEQEHVYFSSLPTNSQTMAENFQQILLNSSRFPQGKTPVDFQSVIHPSIVPNTFPRAQKHTEFYSIWLIYFYILRCRVNFSTDKGANLQFNYPLGFMNEHSVSSGFWMEII